MREAISDYRAFGARQATEHRGWRQQLLTTVSERPPEGNRDLEAVSEEMVDGLCARLLDLNSTLAAAYGTPDLGNKSDPVDELVYIILSRRTREEAYQAAYESLKLRFESWEELVEAPAEVIEGAIGFSGLGRRKAQSLKLALGTLIERFGRCTLEPTRPWGDDETRDFLCTLPEVGPKSAACVMVCSLDRPAFPVDAHVGRVLERLGVFRTVGIELAGADHKVKQRLLWDAVPPSLRYSLHVNLLVHGRVVCLPHAPRCDRCVLSDRCAYAGPGSEGSRPGASRGEDYIHV